MCGESNRQWIAVLPSSRPPPLLALSIQVSLNPGCNLHIVILFSVNTEKLISSKIAFYHRLTRSVLVVYLGDFGWTPKSQPIHLLNSSFAQRLLPQPPFSDAPHTDV